MRSILPLLALASASLLPLSACSTPQQRPVQAAPACVCPRIPQVLLQPLPPLPPIPGDLPASKPSQIGS